MRGSEKTLCPGLIIRLERSPKSATSHFNYKLKLFASSFLFLTTNTKRKKKKYYGGDSTNLRRKPIEQQSLGREEKTVTNDLTVSYSSSDDNILQNVNDHVIDLTDYSSD